jgi:branched-chain amino acid aminotransferase
VGRAKTAGNYAAALYPAKLAQQEGYHQLLWTDAVSHEYIEESGTMNIVFVIDGKSHFAIRGFRYHFARNHQTFGSCN